MEFYLAYQWIIIDILYHFWKIIIECAFTNGQHKIDFTQNNGYVICALTSTNSRAYKIRWK